LPATVVITPVAWLISRIRSSYSAKKTSPAPSTATLWGHVLDEYGATNLAEFFAVATECFFEKPIPLRRKHPQLYEELKAYHRQDPASLVSS
jgi:Mlc titration factor MtfA (ptsG expression regulator)